MSYTQCPHCHRIAGNHGSVISKSIGSPLITCENCKHQIIDNNMYEWGAIPIGSRLNYCLLSNYRIMIHWFAFILPASIMANSSFFIGLLLLIIIEALVCPFLYYCVASLNGDEIEKSINRSKNADYIDCLAEFGYDKLDLKLYNEYLDRRNAKLKLIKSEPFAAKISANAEAEKNVVVEEVKQPPAASANKSDYVEMFYVGSHGRFDALVRSVLRELKKEYPQINYAVVLAYMPCKQNENKDASGTMLPEGIEFIHPRYAISWRNNWMLQRSDFVVTYITHSWGGAAKFANKAMKQGKTVFNVR